MYPAPYALPSDPALAFCDPQHAGYVDPQGYDVTSTGYYQATSLDPYQGYLATTAGPEPEQNFQAYYATPSPEDMVSSTLVAPPSPPSPQQ